MRNVAFKWLHMAMIGVYAKVLGIKLIDEPAARADRFKYPVHFCLANTVGMDVVCHSAVVDEYYSHEISLGCPESRSWPSSIKGPDAVVDSWSDFHCLPISYYQCKFSECS